MEVVAKPKFVDSCIRGEFWNCFRHPGRQTGWTSSLSLTSHQSTAVQSTKAILPAHNVWIERGFCVHTTHYEWTAVSIQSCDKWVSEWVTDRSGEWRDHPRHTCFPRGETTIMSACIEWRENSKAFTILYEQLYELQAIQKLTPSRSARQRTRLVSTTAQVSNQGVVHF